MAWMFPFPKINPLHSRCPLAGTGWAPINPRAMIVAPVIMVLEMISPVTIKAMMIHASGIHG